MATLHLAELPAGFLDEVTGLRDAFVSARTLQNQLVAEVAGERQEKYGTRKEVEIALMKCVLFIAFNNVGDTEVCDVYFDQSFLKPSKPKVFENTLLQGATENLWEHEFNADDEIKAENTGTTPWKLCIAIASDVSCDTGVEVAPGETVTLTADNFGDIINNHFLNITNLDPDHDGSYKVTV